MSYGLKLAGAAIALLLVGILGIVVFEGIWQRVGLGAAVIIVFGGLLFFVWRTEQKDKRRRAGIDELPPV